VLADVAQRYSVPVLEPPVPKSVRFAEAPAAGRTVLRTAPSSPGAQAYREHARRLLAAVDGGGTAADSAGAAPPDGSPSAP
jgi:chromosome partitioning protein